MDTMDNRLTNTPIPEGFKVKYLPARVAKGARRAKTYAIVGATMPRSLAMTPTRR